MKVTKIIPLKIIGPLLLLALYTPPAYTCECSSDPPCKAFRKSTAVFVGQVLEIKENENYDEKKEPLAYYEVRLKVMKRWKGAKQPEITILTDNAGGTVCPGFLFHKGEEYLIFAYGKNRFASTFCAISRPVADKYVPELTRQLGSRWFRLKACLWPF